MKKLMIAAAAMAAGAAFAATEKATEITSANVVGYYTYDLEQGYNFVTPVFEGINGQMSIQDVKIIGSEGWGTEYIFGLDADGLLTGEDFSWQGPDASGFENFAWIDVNGEEANYSFVPGTGFYLFTGSEGLKLQTAGQVTVGAYTRALDQGYNFTGNFSPVDLDLQDLTIEGSEGWGTEYVFGLDADGLLTGVDYSWQGPDASGLDHFAWIDNDGAEATDVTIKAGQALYIFAGSEGLTLKLPAVLPAKAE